MRHTSIECMLWKDILNHYIDATHQGQNLMGMVELVMFILNNKLDEGLYAYVSLSTLIISNHTPLDPMDRSLHVIHQGDKALYSFLYYRANLEEPVWQAEYTEEQAHSKFRAFVNSVSW